MGRCSTGATPLSADVEQEIRAHWWRENQRMAADPACRDWAHIGIGGVMRICHDQDPELAARLGDDLVARMKEWSRARFERGMQQAIDAPFLIGSSSDDVISRVGIARSREERACDGRQRDGGAPPATGTHRAVHHDAEPVGACGRALVGAMRMLREEQRDKVLAAVERSKVAA